MNIWTGLLFLEGAVADGALARELVQDHARESATSNTIRDDRTGAAREVHAGDRPLTGAGLY